MKGIPLVPIYNGDRYIQQQIIGGLDRRDSPRASRSFCTAIDCH